MIAEHRSAPSRLSEGAVIPSANGIRPARGVVPTSPSMTQRLEERKASVRSMKKKNRTTRLFTATENPIHLVVIAYLVQESRKFQHEPELFRQYYGHMKCYEEACTSIETSNHKGLANMAIALGDSSAMLLLRQAIESIRSPRNDDSLQVEVRLPAKDRLEAIYHLDLCMAHLRLARWLHIYKLYEELSKDVGGKDADGFVVLTNKPLSSTQQGNPRNLEQTGITKRMKTVAGGANSEGEGRERLKSSANRLRRIGKRLQQLVHRHQWGIGVLSLLGTGFTDEL